MEITKEEEEEEILEKLWGILIEKKGTIKKIGSKEWLNNLERSNHITLYKDKIKFTDKGYDAAKVVIRRHRLAERLLHDVLDISKSKIEAPSCKFEHILSGDVEESICTLLGHPKECPHGSKIPPGRCCNKDPGVVSKIVCSLSEVKKGKFGKIAYILTQNSSKLQKLMALGVLPGKPIEVIQTFPAYVFQIRHTQVVVDKELADDIYVKVVK